MTSRTTNRANLATLSLALLAASCAAQGGPSLPGTNADTATTSPSAASPSTTLSTSPSSPGASASPSLAPTAEPTSPSPSAAAEARNPAPYETGAPYRYDVDPANFGSVVDNPYLPLVPGTVTTFGGGEERIVVTVLGKKRDILGVSATVVHDQAFSGGEVAEDTYDWYAQDLDGNVWYFGEATEELEGGKVTSRAGSWEAGVKGAVPGIVMLADPRVGDTYRQEYLQGEAEDLARVIEIGGSIKVKAGAYEDTLVTEEWSPLEPKVVEHKTYARGIGIVRETTVKGGTDHDDLQTILRP
jgi:hypothetical protein